MHTHTQTHAHTISYETDIENGNEWTSIYTAQCTLCIREQNIEWQTFQWMCCCSRKTVYSCSESTRFLNAHKIIKKINGETCDPISAICVCEWNSVLHLSSACLCVRVCVTRFWGFELMLKCLFYIYVCVCICLPLVSSTRHVHSFENSWNGWWTFWRKKHGDKVKCIWWNI